MGIAALFDIHGNLPALEAVLGDVREARVDHIVVGGDVLPGPMPRECLDLLSSLDIPTDFIIGNGDRETAAAARGDVSSVIPEFFREAMRWNAAELQPRDLEAIDSWPLTQQLTVDGIGEVLFCHATPRNDTEIFLKTTPDEKLRPIFDSLGVQLVVCGHTHMQFDRIVGRTRHHQRRQRRHAIPASGRVLGAAWPRRDAAPHCLRSRSGGGARARDRVSASRAMRRGHPGAADEQATLEQFKNAELK